MAIRDVRTYFYLRSKSQTAALNMELWTVFNLYMDAVMRGRFASYSGPEVRGVNIVNLKLFEAGYLQGRPRQKLTESWERTLNAYEYETYFDFNALPTDAIEKIYVLIKLSSSYAKKSPLPQMQALASHTAESIDRVDITRVFEKAARYKAAYGIQ